MIMVVNNLVKVGGIFVHKASNVFVEGTQVKLQ